MPAQTVIQLRRDTSANWTSANPVLAAGEAGFDTTENKIKIGDGTTAWNSLDYASGGSGSITVSETAPAEPAEGDLWFNSTNALTYIYYDSFWVDLAPAIAGPTGATGATGEPGIVVQDEAPTDTDVLWLDSDDPADAVAIPAGGATSQVLAKATGDDYDTEWTTLPEAPTPVSSGNAIINGAFEINQRNFTSTTTSGVFGFDRWTTSLVGGTSTYSSQAFTLGAGPSGYESANFARIVTSGQTESDARSILIQNIEDVRSFAGKTITVSFFAKAGSGTPSIAVEVYQNFGSGGSPSAPVFTFVGKPTLSNSWERFSLTIDVPSISGKTIGTTPNTSFLALNLFVSAGSDRNSRTDSLGIQSNTFDIWGVQLEAGSTATAFRRNANSLQGELAACQRYFYRMGGNSINDHAYLVGYMVAAGVGWHTLQMPVQMRGIPSATSSAGSTFYFYNGTNQATPTGIGFSRFTPQTVNVEVYRTSSTSGVVTYLQAGGTQNAFIDISAEL